MRTALLLAISLPLLFGGCKKREGPLGYRFLGDTVSITDCDGAATGKLVIPDTIEGKEILSPASGRAPSLSAPA
jgi:hypothetical protein